MLHLLETRFLSLWRRQALLFDGEIALTLFNDLVEKYSEPWRAYHSISHINNSLNYFDDCSDHAINPDAVELAIWFHDCIYELGATDNEEKSKDWFLARTTDQLSPTLRDEVARLIMDTTHKHIPATDDGRLLADIDMSSFSRPWDQYVRDSQAVRDEHGEPDSAEMDAKLVRFLQSLISNGPMYHSPFYAEHYEHKARENIARHITLLSNQ